MVLTNNSNHINNNGQDDTGVNGGDGGNGQHSTNDLTKEMQQYYMDIVKRNVHDNSQYNKIWKKYTIDPRNLTGKKRDNRYKVDFNDFDDKFLRLYKDRFIINDLKDNYTLNGYLLQTELGSKTSSFKKNNKSLFIPKPVTDMVEEPIKEEALSKESTSEETNQNMNSAKYLTQKEKEKNKIFYVKDNLNKTIINGNRTSREELVKEVEKHFKENYQVKETEAISQFVYKIKKDNKKFKLEF
ncbi:hypothetical protein QEN19_003724 [Hanseniaspora menglaensis]